MLQLERMTDEEFRASLGDAIIRRAEEQVALGLWAGPASDEASREYFRQLLPQGRETRGHHFDKVIVEQEGRRIGETWYAIQTVGGKTQFWIDWITIHSPYRRSGHATRVLNLLEAKATQVGADRIGLRVLSKNVAAISLYSKLGYETIDQRMAKRPCDRPGP